MGLLVKRFRFIVAHCSAVFAAAFSAQAVAANITILNQERGSTIVAIEGNLALEDGEKFANLVRPLGRTVVLLNSPGGNLFAGLRIGQLIHNRRFSTIVADGDLCASACALAWVGGSARYLGPRSRLGFHAAYSAEGDVSHVSSSGNALVGAYLDRLGLSDKAIFYLTAAAPEEILWLDVATANKLGIAAKAFVGDDIQLAPSIETQFQSLSSQVALKLVNDYFSAGSSDATTAISWLSDHYGSSLRYYGKSTPLAVVLRQKRVFVKRWPERVYIPVDSSLIERCSPDGRTCRVSGTVQFECRSYLRGAYSSGLAYFALTVILTGARPVITEENSRVLVRR